MTTMQQRIAADIARHQAKSKPTRKLIQPENRLAYMRGRIAAIKRKIKRNKDRYVNWQCSMIDDRGTGDLI